MVHTCVVDKGEFSAYKRNVQAILLPSQRQHREPIRWTIECVDDRGNSSECRFRFWFRGNFYSQRPADVTTDWYYMLI